MSNELPEVNHESKDPEIRQFQRNLATFRKLAGWTAQDLGDKVGITKQSVHNLECIPCKVCLSSGRYVMIRSVLEQEANERLKNDDMILRRALDVLLAPEAVDDTIESEKEKVAYLETDSEAQKRGTDKKYIASMLTLLVPLIGSVPFAGAIATIGSTWLERYLNKNKKPV